MLRRLLNIASIVCLVACVALMGLWVRSCDSWDALHGRFTDSQGFQIASLRGRLCVTTSGETLTLFAAVRFKILS